MDQSIKFLLLLFFSVFIHLAILQISFESGLPQSSTYSTTEVALVQRSRLSRTLSETFQQTPQDTDNEVPAPVAANKSIENSEPVEHQTVPVSQPKITEASKGELLPHRIVDAPVMTSNPDLSGPSSPPRRIVGEFASLTMPEGATVSDRPVSTVSSIEDKVDTTEGTMEVEVKNLARKEIRPLDSEPILELPTTSKNTEKSNPKLRSTGTGSVAEEKVLTSGLNVTTEGQHAIPRYDINPRPVYPDIALRKGWEGLVLLRVAVKKDGRVKRVDLEESSGFNALDRAALKAVRRWKFVPAMSAGLPAEGAAMVPINFDLP